MADRRKAGLVGDFRDIQFPFPDQFQGFLQADGTNKIRDRLPGEGFELAVQVHAAHAEVPADMIAIEVRLVDMFEDVCSKVGNELIFLPVGVVTCGSSPILIPLLQQAADLDELFDAQGQFLRAEGLGEVGVGAALQALEAAFQRGPGSQQDEGDVGGTKVAPNGLGNGKAVLFRHHQVRDDQVGDQGCSFLDALFSIGGFGDVVPGRVNAVTNVFPHFGIVFNEEQFQWLSPTRSGSLRNGGRFFFQRGRNRQENGVCTDVQRLGLIGLQYRQQQLERSAFTDFTGHPDLAALKLHQFFDQGKADTRAAGPLPASLVGGGVLSLPPFGGAGGA